MLLETELSSMGGRNSTEEIKVPQLSSMKRVDLEKFCGLWHEIAKLTPETVRTRGEHSLSSLSPSSSPTGTYSNVNYEYIHRHHHYHKDMDTSVASPLEEKKEKGFNRHDPLVIIKRGLGAKPGVGHTALKSSATPLDQSLSKFTLVTTKVSLEEYKNGWDGPLFFTNTSTFWILDTDYTTFALLGEPERKRAWILCRETRFTSSKYYKNLVERLINEFGYVNAESDLALTRHI